MGALLSIPLAGSLGTVATSAIAGCAFCFTSKAASLAFKSCNCNSSIATRVGFAVSIPPVGFFEGHVADDVIIPADILTELASGVVDEDALGHSSDPGKHLFTT